MKVKVGGTLSYKIQVGAYEPTEVSSFIEVEKDIDIDEQIVELQEKIDSILINDINKKVKLACQNYKNVKEILRRSI